MYKPIVILPKTIRIKHTISILKHEQYRLIIIDRRELLAITYLIYIILNNKNLTNPKTENSDQPEIIRRYI